MPKNVLGSVLGALSKAKRQLEMEARKIADQIAQIDSVLGSTAKGGRAKAAARKKRGGKRRISAAGRARIAAAQRKRWAKVRAAKKAQKA
jgi:hypothetical protein